MNSQRNAPPRRHVNATAPHTRDGMEKRVWHTHWTRDIKPVGVCPGCDRRWILTSAEFSALTSNVAEVVVMLRRHIGEYTDTAVTYLIATPGAAIVEVVLSGIRFRGTCSTDGVDLTAAPVNDPEQVTRYDDALRFYTALRDTAEPPADREWGRFER